MAPDHKNNDADSLDATKRSWKVLDFIRKERLELILNLRISKVRVMVFDKQC